MGKTGRGVHEYCNVMDRVDITTGTFGKALGGGSGGYTSGRQEIIDLCGSDPAHLFSNTLAPSICAASLKVLDMLEASTDLRDQLEENTHYFRAQCRRMDSRFRQAIIQLFPSCRATQFWRAKCPSGCSSSIFLRSVSSTLLYRREARIRVQISAGHTKADLDKSVMAFATARDELA